VLTRAAPDVEGGAQPPRLQVDAGLSHGCTGMRRGLQRHRRTFTGPGDAQVVQTRRLLAGRGRGRRLPAGHGPGRRLGCTGGPTLRVVGRAAGGNAPERQHGQQRDADAASRHHSGDGLLVSGGHTHHLRGRGSGTPSPSHRPYSPVMREQSTFTQGSGEHRGLELSALPHPARQGPRRRLGEHRVAEVRRVDQQRSASDAAAGAPGGRRAGARGVRQQ